MSTPPRDIENERKSEVLQSLRTFFNQFSNRYIPIRTDIETLLNKYEQIRNKVNGLDNDLSQVNNQLSKLKASFLANTSSDTKENGNKISELIKELKLQLGKIRERSQEVLREKINLQREKINLSDNILELLSEAQNVLRGGENEFSRTELESPTMFYSQVSDYSNLIQSKLKEVDAVKLETLNFNSEARLKSIEDGLEDFVRRAMPSKHGEVASTISTSLAAEKDKGSSTEKPRNITKP